MGIEIALAVVGVLAYLASPDLRGPSRLVGFGYMPQPPLTGSVPGTLPASLNYVGCGLGRCTDVKPPEEQ